MSGFKGEFDVSGLTEMIVAAVSDATKKATEDGMTAYDKQTENFNKELQKKATKTQKNTEKIIKDMVISSEKQINSIIRKSKINLELPIELKVKTTVNGRSFISGFDTSSYKKDIMGIKSEFDELQNEINDIISNSSPNIKGSILESANNSKINNSSISKYINTISKDGNGKNPNSDLQNMIIEREKLFVYLKKLQSKASGFNIENNKSQPDIKEHFMLLKECLETAKLLRDVENTIYSKGVNSTILLPKVTDKSFEQIEKSILSLQKGVKNIYDEAVLNKLNALKESIMAEIELRDPDPQKIEGNKTYNPNNNPIIPKTKKRSPKVDISEQVYEIEDISKYLNKRLNTLDAAIRRLGESSTLRSQTKQKDLVGYTAAYIQKSGMSLDEVLDHKNEKSPFLYSENLVKELNRLLVNNQLNKLFEDIINFTADAKTIEQPKVETNSTPPSNNNEDKPPSKWSVGSTENKAADLDEEIEKLKKIEELQRRNEQDREQLKNKRKDYGKYALGRTDDMAVYDYDKLTGASTALKNFNYQLEKRNQFQQKYNELCTIIEDYFVGDYSLGGFKDLEQYIYINSSMKRLSNMNNNINEKGTVQGIKGFSTKDIDKLFYDASKYLKTIGTNVNAAISNEEVTTTRVFARIEAEAIQLGEEQTRLYNEWQAQKNIISKIKEENFEEFEKNLKLEESKKRTAAESNQTPSSDTTSSSSNGSDNTDSIRDKTDEINKQTEAINNNTEADLINNKSIKEKIQYIKEYIKELKFLETADDKKMDMLNNSWDAGGNNPKNQDDSLRKIKAFEEHVERMQAAEEATENFQNSWESLIIKMKDGSKIEVADLIDLSNMKLLVSKIEDISFNPLIPEESSAIDPAKLLENKKLKELHDLRTKSKYLDNVGSDISPVAANEDLNKRQQLIHSILAEYKQAQEEMSRIANESAGKTNEKIPELAMLIEELAIKFRKSIDWRDTTADSIIKKFNITKEDLNIKPSGLKDQYDELISKYIDNFNNKNPELLNSYVLNTPEYDMTSVYSSISEELDLINSKGKDAFESINVELMKSIEYVKNLKRLLNTMTEANSGRPSKYGNDIGVALRNYPELEPFKTSKSVTDEEFNEFLNGNEKAKPYLNSIGYVSKPIQEAIVTQKELNEELVETAENQKIIDTNTEPEKNLNKVKEQIDVQKELNEELSKTSSIIKNTSDVPTINSENSIEQFQSQIEELDKEIAILTEKRDTIVSVLGRYDGDYKNSEYVKRIKEELKSKNFDIAAVLYENLNLSHPKNKFDINKLGKDFVDNFEMYLSRGKVSQQLLLSQLDTVNSPLGELRSKKHNATMGMLALQAEQENINQQNKIDSHNTGIINSLDIKTIDDAWKSATNSLGEYKTALKDMSGFVSNKEKLENLSDEEINKIDETGSYFQLLMDTCASVIEADQRIQDAKLKITESISKYISLGGNEKFVTDIAEINKDIELLYKKPLPSPAKAIVEEFTVDKVSTDDESANRLKFQEDTANKLLETKKDIKQVDEDVSSVVDKIDEKTESVINKEERRLQIEQEINDLSEKQLKSKIKTAQTSIAGNKSTAEKYKEELPIYQERYELLVKEREELERLAAAKWQEQVDARVKEVTSHVSKNYSAPSPDEVEALFLDKMNEITSRIPTEASNKTWKMDNLTGEISGQLQYINAATKQVVTETYKWVSAVEDGEEAFGELVHISSSFSDKEIDRLEAQRRSMENLEKAKTRYNSKLSGVDGQFSNLKEYKDVESAINELTNSKDSVSSINKVDTAFNVLNKTINEFKQNVKDTGTFDTVKTALIKLNNIDNIVENYRQEYLKMGLSAEEAAQRVESLVESSSKLNAIDLSSATGMKELGEVLNEFNTIESGIKNSIPIEKNNIQIAERNAKNIKAAYDENLKVIKELESETSNLNNLQAKQEFGNGKSEWASQIEDQNKKVTKSAEDAAEAINNIKKLYEDGKINQDKYTSANTFYEQAQDGSTKSQAAYTDKKAAFEREQGLKNEKIAAEQLKHTLSELVSAYSALAQDSKGQKSATFFEDIAQVKQARNAFEEARNKAVELGLSLEEVSRLEGNALNNISTNIGRSGAKIIDEYITEIDKLEDKLRSSGNLTQKSFNEIEHLRMAAESIQSGKDLNNFTGMQNYLEKLNHFGSRLKDTLSNIESVGKFDTLAMQVDYFDNMTYKTATFQSTLSDLKKEWQNFRELQNSTTDKNIIDKAQIELIERTTKALSILHKEASGKGNIVEDSIGKVNNESELKTAMDKYADTLGYANKIGDTSKNLGDQLSATYKNQSGEVLKLTATINGYKNAMSVVTNEQKGATGVLGNMNQLLNGTGRVFAMYFSGYRIIASMTRQLRQGMAALKDYDYALTSISYTMQMSSENLSNLGKSALSMANDLNTSVKDALSIYQIYANMNTSMKEIAETAKPTAILSNLSGIGSDVAADQIQGILNQFSMLEDNAQSVADVSMHVVDVLDNISVNVAIDYAKGIKIISDAVQTSGQAAYDAGLSYEQLAAISAKVAERTRDDGGSIGNAIKTITTRISKVGKMPAYADEVSNEDLSKASDSLNTVGIDVYNKDGSFRELDVILTELASKWDSLTDAQQANIAFSVAATNQSNKFRTVLMAWSDAMDLAEESTNSNGNALANQEKYTESYVGKLQSIKTQMDTFWINFLDSSATKFVLDSFDSVANALNKIADSTSPIVSFSIVLSGLFLTLSKTKKLLALLKVKDFSKSLNLGAILKKTSGAFKSFVSTVSKSDNIFVGVGKSLKGLWGAMTSFQKFSIVAMGIGVVIGAFNLLTTSTKETEEAVDNIKSKYKELSSTAETNKKNVAAMSDEYTNLSKGVDSMGKNLSLTNDEYERYHEICNEIASMYPGLVTGFDAQGNAILNLKDNIAELNEEYEKQKVAAANEYIRGASNYKDDFNNKTKGNLWDKVWDFGKVDAGGLITYTEAIKTLNEVRNQSFEEFFNYAYDPKNNAENETAVLYLQGLGFNAEITKEQFDGLKMMIPSEILSLNNVIQETISNINQEGVSWLDRFFNDKSGDYYNTPDFVKSAMYNIANNMNEELISSLYENDISIGSYIESILNSFNSNPRARVALNSLVSIDEDSSIDKQKKIISKNISILSAELGRDENELKLSLGLENFDKLESDFNKLIDVSKDMFDIDSDTAKRAFDELSINTEKEVDLMLECVKGTNNFNSAIDEFNSKKINNELEDSFSNIKENTNTLLGNFSKINEVINSQDFSSSISLEDFTSDELKDYTSALEYQNGVYKLNEDAVKKLIKSKADEAIANTEAAKSLEQEQYVKNYEKIEKLRRELKELSGDAKDSKIAEIDVLMSANDTIAAHCQNYDLLTASIRETIGVYSEWKNAQNASESGDMFDDTFNMIQEVRDINTPDSEKYMKVGLFTYKAAVDFLVPDEIDHDDMAAVAKYVGSIESYLLHDEDGKITGLNVQQFLDKSIESGLMENDGSGNYQVLGEKSMEDFATGLGLSLPMVQAIFGELKEYDFKFKWTDEATNSINSFAMAGVKAANELSNLDLGLDLVVNVSDLATAEEKTARLDETIKAMNEYQSTLEVDSEQYKLAADVITYCNLQKVILEQPAIMDVDATKINGKMQEVVTAIQELQVAKDNLNQLEIVGADTTEANQNVSNLLKKVQELKESNSDIFIKLGIDDTSSVESIEEKLKLLTPEVMVNIGIPAEAIANFKKDTKVVVEVDDKASKKIKDIEDSITELSEDNPTVLDIKANTSTASLRLNNLLETIKEVKENSNIEITTRSTEYKNTISTNYNSGNNGREAYAGGTAHVSGNYTPRGGRAFVNGNAKLEGDWGMQSGERVLIGELGREIVVDPNTGKWRTYGDNGAEFAYIPKDAIIFNHLQSESLLNQGFINSRATSALAGKAFAGGNVTGGGGWNPPKPQVNYPYTPDYTSNTSAVEENTKAVEETSQKFDWIERSLKRFTQATESIANKISEFITFDKKNNLISQQISSVKDQINANNSAYNAYMNKANAVGLSSSYKDKIISGTFNIEEINTTDGANKALLEQIQNFQEYYDKAIECSIAVSELNKQISELAQSQFDNVASKYDSKISEITHMTNMVEKGLDIISSQGRFASSNYFDSLINIENQNIKLLKEEYNALTTAFNKAIDTGKIEVYSEAWYDMTSQINEVKEALQDANLALIDYKNQMREMDWSVFDKAQEYISNISQETNFLIDLLDNKDLFDEKGNITNEGQSVAGLYAVNYNTYMAQSQEYAKEIEKINKDIANDPYNTLLVDRRNELLQLQMDSIKAAEGEKNSIIDLVSKGYDKMLESLQKIIDKRKEALNAEKDMYNYEKSISQKTEKITDYQKQLSALENDNSEESKSKKQQLQDSLKEAQEDLKDTEYDKWISDQEKLLDALYSDYEEFINLKLDDVNGLLTDIINSTNENANLIQETIKGNTDNVGYTISDTMDKIWNISGNGIGKVVSDFNVNFTNSITTVQSAVDSCKSYLSSILDQVKKESSTNTGGTINNSGGVATPPSSTTPTPSPAPTPPPTPAPAPSKPKGYFFVSKKDYYPKNKLQINTSIVDRLKYHDFDSSFAQARNYYVAMGLGSASSYTGSASQNTNMISWMKKNGFSKGGTLGKAIKNSGESGFFLGRSGEEVLSIPKLELAGNMVDKLISLNALAPNIGDVAPYASSGEIKFIVEEINLPNVTDSKEFATEFVNVLKNNNNVQRAIRAVSTDLITGKNSLSIKKIR